MFSTWHEDGMGLSHCPETFAPLSSVPIPLSKAKLAGLVINNHKIQW